MQQLRNLFIRCLKIKKSSLSKIKHRESYEDKKNENCNICIIIDGGGCQFEYRFTQEDKLENLTDGKCWGFNNAWNRESE